jgi:hypothetical protein
VHTLTHRYSRYCSAFTDTDGVFGSLGSFFSFRPREGCYEANPPFVPFVIAQMARHMEELLMEATGPLCFVIIIPAWSEDSNHRAVQRASEASWKM